MTRGFHSAYEFGQRKDPGADFGIDRQRFDTDEIRRHIDEAAKAVGHRHGGVQRETTAASEAVEFPRQRRNPYANHGVGTRAANAIDDARHGGEQPVRRIVSHRGIVNDHRARPRRDRCNAGLRQRLGILVETRKISRDAARVAQAADRRELHAHRALKTDRLDGVTDRSKSYPKRSRSSSNRRATLSMVLFV